MSQRQAGKSLIVQGDQTIFLEVEQPLFKQLRERLSRFAELEKSPRYVHVYRMTPLSLWNAAASGVSAGDILEFLSANSKYPVPRNVRNEILKVIARYGQVKLVRSGEELRLTTTFPGAIEAIRNAKNLDEFFVGGYSEAGVEPSNGGPLTERRLSLVVNPEHRGSVKIALTEIGFPVEDVAGYQDGAALAVPLNDSDADGGPFRLRPYQREAVDAFYDAGRSTGGSGVVVLPCGAGKTIVAIGALHRVGCQGLILTTNTTALRQWKRELLSKTQLDPELVGEYSGERKEIRPVTITTYQMLTYRHRKTKDFVHYKLFTAKKWGLVVYDEVHLLPAPVFRFTAQIQATRRLGLTATLVREDGREAEVFSLVGPKKYDVPWKALESEGWIATADCVVVRTRLDREQLRDYEGLDKREQFRLASENYRKNSIVSTILGRHRQDGVLILGQYLNQLKRLQRELGAPLITGKTANDQRETLYSRFRRGEIPVLIVSKVGNFAVDLPDATVAIQVSGTFGSRQEEAQRLGRILRPKVGGKRAVFYTIITRDTSEQEFAEKRQRFLSEQGYRFEIVEDTLLGNPATVAGGQPFGA